MSKFQLAFPGQFPKSFFNICKKLNNFYCSDSVSNEELVKRLLDFMNIKIEVGTGIVSPDKDYVLTHDNLTKIMAIQTRFR